MDAKDKLALISAWTCVILLTLAMSFLDNSFQFIVPTIRQSIGIIGILSGICLIVRLIATKGIKYIVFISIPYLVLFLLLEFGTRIWLSHFANRSERVQYVDHFESPADLGLESIYVPHHYTLYNLRSNFSTPEGTIHNRLGFRDHRDLYPEENVIRIVFIGGSTTYTIGIKENRQIFSYGLEQRLNEYYKDHLDGYTIQVVNAGMGGATSSENLLRLIFFVSEIAPDLVVIQHGFNDIWPRIRGHIQSDFGNYRKSWGKPEPTPNEPFLFPDKPIIITLTIKTIKESVFFTFLLRRLGYQFPKDHLHHIYDLVNRSDVETNIEYLSQNSTKYFERNTRYMIAICRSMKTQVLLVTEPYTEKLGEPWNIAMPEHNALLARIAKEENTLFYDFANEMIKNDVHLPDGRHVNQQGSDMKRTLFFTYFIEQDIIPKLKNQKGDRSHFIEHANHKGI